MKWMKTTYFTPRSMPHAMLYAICDLPAVYCQLLADKG